MRAPASRCEPSAWSEPARSPPWSCDRPERRNAVDGPTAALLADAFRAFDADPTAAVAVLWGAGGTFCSGADLTAVGTDRTATASSRTATDRWDRPGCGSASR